MLQGLSCFQRWDARSSRSVGADKTATGLFYNLCQTSPVYQKKVQKGETPVIYHFQSSCWAKKKNKRHHSLLLLWKALIPCSMSFPSQMQHTKTRRRHELLPNWPIFFSSFTNHVNKDKTHLIFIEKTQFPLSKVRSRPRSPGGESPPDLFTEMPRRGFLRDPPCKSLKLHCPTKSWDKLTPLSKRGCQAFIFPPLSADAGAE